MWIEIFKGGRQTDSNGRTHDGDSLIDSAVAGFDAGAHRPPLVLGHPKDDSPAYGWVNGVKSQLTGGVNRLMADIAPVDALKGWVNGKLYQNRSAAFYADGRLRHVGFLGGHPPAVKGLAPLPAFSDDDAHFEFVDVYQQGLIARVLRRLREYFIEKDGADAADRLISDWEIEEIGRVPDEPEAAIDASLSLYSQTPTKGVSMKFSEFLNAINLFKKSGGTDEEIDLIAPAIAGDPPAGKAFTEADVEVAKKQAAEQARHQAQAEFAEAEGKRRRAERAGKIGEFCEAGVAAGKIAPAWVAAGIAQFMEQLAFESAAAIEFCEGGEKKTPDTWFREFLDGLPKLIEFSEIATRDKDVGSGDAAEQLDSLVFKKRQDNQDLDYTAAFSEVQREHPDLAAEYAESISG